MLALVVFSNVCSGIIPPNTCNKCERDIISKAALKKHMPNCQGKKQREACKNGDSCRWFKANRCLFVHSSRSRQANTNQNQRPIIDQRQVRQKSHQMNNQEWKTVQRRNRKPLWTCNFCSENIFNQEASRSHGSTCRAKYSNSQNSLPHKRQQFWCKFQDRCNKGLFCEFKHLEGFPKRNPPQNHH